MFRQTLGHTLEPIRDRSIATSSKTYRYSTNLKVVIDANSHLGVATGVPLPSSRNECRASTESHAWVHKLFFGRQAVVAVLSAQRVSVTPTNPATASVNSAGCSRCP